MFKLATNSWLLLQNNRGAGSRKSLQQDIDEIYIYVKETYEARYQLLISKRESTDLNYFNDCEAFVKYSK